MAASSKTVSSMVTRFEAAKVGYDQAMQEKAATMATAPLPEDSSFVPIETSSALGKYAGYIIVAYLVAGSAFFSWAEEWSWDDALYFCIVTMTTIGYGDLVPTTDTSKLAAIVYIIFGARALSSRSTASRD